MENKIRIVSDGTAKGTKIYAGDVEIGDVTRIELLPIESDGVVQARIAFARVELDVIAEQAS